MLAMRTVVLSIALLCTATWAQAMEVGGVKFNTRATVADQELVLNGVGLRTRLLFKIYAMALYLPAKTSSAQTAIASGGAKRIHIVTLRDLSGQQLADALVEGLRNNHDKAELEKLDARVQSFRTTMLGIAASPEGTHIFLDYLPATGTRLTVGNSQRGADIPGEDFYQALLRVWLGQQPAQGELRERLLGA